MLKKALAGAVGLAVLITCTSIALIAGAFALFFATAPQVGAAVAALFVALLFGAVVGGVTAFVVLRKPQPDPEPEHGMLESLLGMAKERPLMSVAAALAATVIAFRNPALVATIAAAFLDRGKNGK